MTIYVSQASWPDGDHPLGLPTRSCSRSGNGASASWSAVTHSVAPHLSVKRTLYCYAQEHLASRLRDVVEIHEAADRVATGGGYRLGPLFIEEAGSGQAMQALIEVAAAFHDGGAAVAVPSRGHFIPLGRPHEWQVFLEQITGHPLLFTSRIH
ncbi:hypothetical protein AB0P21_10360 [Kribbella sp. NPDC056861]|uniref:hypothetical protein n=1 Tax=Kribbella sp. NPDC056861 TaxID=3154857 RepID=UPI0034310652